MPREISLLPICQCFYSLRMCPNLLGRRVSVLLEPFLEFEDIWIQLIRVIVNISDLSLILAEKFDCDIRRVQRSAGRNYRVSYPLALFLVCRRSIVETRPCEYKRPRTIYPIAHVIRSLGKEQG
jgi:hypothetical protein